MDSATKDGRDSNRTVYITDVPADVDEEDLELYLTNKRLGGGEIDDLQLDASNRTALVKFAASEVAERLLRRKFMDIFGGHLAVLPSLPTAATSDEHLQTTGTQLSSLQAGQQMKQLDQLALDQSPLQKTVCYEADKSGGDSKNVYSGSNMLETRGHSPSEETSHQTSDKSDVQGWSDMSQAKVQSPLKKTSHSENGETGAHSDLLQTQAHIPLEETSHLERDKSHIHSGSDLSETQVQTSDVVVHIPLEETSHLERDKSHIHSGSDLSETQAQTSDVVVTVNSGSRTIYIHDVPADLADVMEAWLESPKHGGSAVDTYCFDANSRVVVVTFADIQVAERFVARGVVQLAGCELSVTRERPPQTTTAGKDRQDSSSETDRANNSTVTESSETDDVLGRCVFIENVPAEMCDFLEAVIENRNSGGGPVEEFEPDPVRGGVLVRFVDQQVAKSLLAAGKMEFGSTILTVVAPPSNYIDDDDDDNDDAGTEGGRNAVRVSSIPRSMSLQMLKTFLESDKVGAGPISDIDYHDGDDTAIVCFQQADVARDLLAAGRIQFKNCVLNISEPCDKTEVDSDVQASMEPDVSDTVQVVDVPLKLQSMDSLTMFFENSRRSGGGEITNAVFTSADKSTARITFKEPHVAESLLRTCEVTFSGSVMRVVKPSLDDFSTSTVTEPALIYLTGIPPGTKDDMVIMYLENKRKSGGGPIRSIQYDDVTGTAVVCFEDDSIAENMLRRGQIEFMRGSTLTVTSRPATNEEHCHRPSAVAQTDLQSGSIQLSDIPRGTKKDTLILFLENKRKCGGGTVKNMDYSESMQTATVTFEDHHIGEEMLRRGRLEFLNGSVLTVTRSQASSPCSEASEQQNHQPLARARTVMVDGVTKQLDKEQLELYFENRGRSGGGPVQQIVMHGTCAQVTFNDPQDALRASQQAKHTLSKVTLNVTLQDTWPHLTSCAVKVTGFKDDISDDTVTLFFESAKRSGGGTVEEIVIDEQERSVVIVFESRDVAERVSNHKPMILNGVSLQVEWLKPGRCPPVSTGHVSNDSLLFVDLPANIEVQRLRDYASKAAGVRVDQIMFSAQPGVALVQYSAPIDYSRVRETLCGKPCQGQMISVQRLTECTSVQVHNVASLDESALQMYFESRRSGGCGEIKDWTFEPQKGYAIVEFHDQQTTKRVLSVDKHQLSKQTLDVRPYYPSFGVLPPGFDSSVPRQPLPEELVVDCAPEVVAFVFQNKQHKHKIEETMKRNGCFVVWPHSRSEKLILRCIINPTQPDAFVKLSSWSQRTPSLFQQQLDSIKLASEQILHEIWAQVKEKVESEFRFGSEEMMVHWEDRDGIVHVCGLSTKVNEFLNVLRKTRTALEDQLAKLKQRIEEKFALKPHQILLLKTLNLGSQYAGKEVTLNFMETEVVLVGHLKDVQQVKLEILQKASSMTSSSFQCWSEGVGRLVKKPDVQRHFHSLLENAKVQAALDVYSDEVTVHGFKQKDVQHAIQLIKEDIRESTVTLHKRSAGFFRSHPWNVFRSEASKEFELADIAVSECTITVTAVNQLEKELEKRLREFLDKTVEVRDYFPIRSAVTKLLRDLETDKIDKLRQQMRAFKLEIQFEGDSGCHLKVILGGLQKAKSELKTLIDSVKSKTHAFEAKSHVKYLENPTSRGMVKAIAIQSRVVINFPDEESEQMTAAAAQNFDPYVFSEVEFGSGKKIRLVVGDIAKYSADVIVNAANSRLDHGAGVAGAIARAGGTKLISECNDHVRKHGQLPPGKVFVSSAGSLPCKSVIHTVGPIWKDGSNNEDKDLRLAVKAAVEEADHRKLRTMSVPAISCGVYGFPVVRGARIILTCLREVLTSCRCVTEVSLVSGRTIIQSFHDTLTTTFKPTDVKRGQHLAEPDDDEQVEEADDDSDYDMSPATRRTEHIDHLTTSSSSLHTADGLTVSVVRGSITDQQADVIFCTAEKNLDLSRGVIAKTISTAAGPRLQQDTTATCTTGIDYGQVVKMPAYNLAAAKNIYLGACCRWDGGKTGQSEKCLRSLMRHSLELAAKDHVTSISFPAIGSGNLHFPQSTVSDVMFDEVISFSAHRAGAGHACPLTNVYFVVYEKDQATIDAFESELKSKQSGSGSTPVVQSHSTQRRSYRNTRSVKKLDCEVGLVKLRVKYGDICKERCDAIVNSTNAKLDLSVGALSKSILQAAGGSIQQECKDSGWQSEGVAVTSAGRLPCQKIFHLYAARSDMNAWRAVIGRCFTEADRAGVKSLAMPPVGTGGAGAGQVKSVSEAIFEAISTFASSGPQNLRQICITVQQRGMVDDFISAIEKAERNVDHSLKSVWTQLKDKAVKYFNPSEAEQQKPQFAGSRSPERPRSAPWSRGTAGAKMVLSVYGMTYPAIDSALHRVEQLCKEAEKTQVVRHADVSKLSPSQEKRIKALERRHEVRISINKAAGEVRLEGNSDSLPVVVPAIYEIIIEVKDKEKLDREVELLAKQADWQYTDGQKTTAFDQYPAGLLEKAYQEKKPTCMWKDAGGGKHSVTLATMTYQHSDGKQYSVSRNTRGGSGISLPSSWSPMKQTDQFIAVPIAAQTTEYNTVQQHFTATSQSGYSTIVKIERIQNPYLYLLYMTNKAQMDARNPGGQNEKQLWHGTASNNVQNINSRNFNRSYGGVHGLAIGNGVYFAVNSNYSIRGYCPADGSGHKYIYQARVLTGKSTQGASGMKEPPAGYDSVHSGNAVYVVFYDSQTYPEYLITFK